jgi:hypothetical protein
MWRVCKARTVLATASQSPSHFPVPAVIVKSEFNAARETAFLGNQGLAAPKAQTRSESLRQKGVQRSKSVMVRVHGRGGFTNSGERSSLVFGLLFEA